MRRLNRLRLWFADSPLAWALLCYVVSLVLIAPWSNYPLNDDWMYAWIAKRFGETGELKIDMRLAPTLIMQTLLAWPVIQIAGFSHTAMRLLTLGMGGLALVFANHILRVCRMEALPRGFALLLWVFNPLFVNLACSFMTELYGYAFALAGCFIWLHARAKGTLVRPISWSGALGAASLAGLAFWSRQFCTLLLPALWGATVALHGIRWHREPRPRQPVSWSPLITTPLVQGAIITAYFPWSKAHSSFREQFAVPLTHLLDPAHIDWMSAGMSFYCLAIYAPFFALPLLATIRPWAHAWNNRYLIVFFLGAEYLGYQACMHVGTPWELFGHFHRSFPILTNIITDYGLGPTNFGDRLVPHAVRPGSFSWWGPLYGVLLVAMPVHAAYGARRVQACLRDFAAPLRQELCLFGMLLAAGALTVVCLAFREEIIDRYLMSSMVGLLFASAATVRDGDFLQSRAQRVGISLVLAMFAFYCIASMHDYFRLNDARWDLYNQAMALGAGPLDVDGGYELNGWAMASAHAVAPEANTGYYSGPKRFAITLTEIPGTQTAASKVVDTWIMRLPPLLLRQR